jgi:DNA segregation ATPase FtsK/SpoIIIE, S-DNA-T family
VTVTTAIASDPDDGGGGLPPPGAAALLPPPLARADAEQVVTPPPGQGRPVDPPDPPRTVPGEVLASKARRRPILAGWARTRAGWAQAAAALVDLAWYWLLFHVVRLPKYAGKTMFWGTVGGAAATGWVVRWAVGADGAHQLMQSAARGNKPADWLQLDKARRQRAKWRWAAVAAAVVAVSAVVLAARVWASGAQQAVLAAAVLAMLARLGRPADRPITDRVTEGERFVKLTAEMVRAALCSIGLSGVKDPAAVKFAAEIHRDGPGYLARVNLPLGVTAVEVIERRDKLSSGLRLPVDQVWPQQGPDHAGQLDLWVGLLPASKMSQPAWSLLRANARTSVFEPAEFATNPRQRPVATPLFARNFLIGGQPGSGKSYAARTLALMAALDPTAELKIAEFKGTADFGDLAHLCSDYVCGVDDRALRAGAEILAWGLAEAERRGKRILKARERGEAPEGKVTPELAARPGSGLHPVVIILDEVHELFAADKQVAEAAERLIKRGRALALVVVLATQIPDAKSLPPNITRCVAVRWCLSVGGQVENDMILGTGAYKRGLSATAYRPGADAGWGVLTGLAEDTPARSFYPAPDQAAAIIARATALRGQRVVGGDAEPGPSLDVLGDAAAAISASGRPGLQWAALAAALAEAKPELYAAATAETVSAMVRGHGVPTRQVKAADGTNTYGCRRADVLAAMAARELPPTPGSAPGSATEPGSADATSGATC